MPNFIHPHPLRGGDKIPDRPGLPNVHSHPHPLGNAIWPERGKGAQRGGLRFSLDDELSLEMCKLPKEIEKASNHAISHVSANAHPQFRAHLVQMVEHDPNVRAVAMAEKDRAPGHNLDASVDCHT